MTNVPLACGVGIGKRKNTDKGISESRNLTVFLVISSERHKSVQMDQLK